jgi:c-di-GMP-binding flagellar brake protein YcgR
MSFLGKKPNPDDKKSSGDKRSYEERRKYKRIKKNFILTYFLQDKPSQKHEITQLKNISKGGMCFVSSQQLPLSAVVCVELQTPFLTESVRLQGEVLGSHEKVKDMLYETRLQFVGLKPETEYLLSQLLEFFENGENLSYE